LRLGVPRSAQKGEAFRMIDEEQRKLHARRSLRLVAITLAL
jgi:hypothetical protein